MKEQLLALLNQMHTEEQALINSLSDEERSKPGAVNDLAIKDIIAHITEWKYRGLRRLDGQTFPPTDTSEALDQANAEIFHTHHAKSWDDVIAFSNETHQETISRLHTYSEEEIIDPKRFEHLKGTPIWRRMIGNGYMHPMQHYREIYARRGNEARALQFYETATEQLLTLTDAHEWRGATIYNLACAYALDGQADRAIKLLAEALQLSPNLIEWSKQDPDFASIREEPGYKAVYTS